MIPGEKVFADSASLVGGIGAIHRHFNFKKALEDQDIYVEKYSTSEYNYLEALIIKYYKESPSQTN